MASAHLVHTQGRIDVATHVLSVPEESMDQRPGSEPAWGADPDPNTKT
jgi:hypothetical protein